MLQKKSLVNHFPKGDTPKRIQSSVDAHSTTKQVKGRRRTSDSAKLSYEQLNTALKLRHQLVLTAKVPENITEVCKAGEDGNTNNIASGSLATGNQMHDVTSHHNLVSENVEHKPLKKSAEKTIEPTESSEFLQKTFGISSDIMGQEIKIPTMHADVYSAATCSLEAPSAATRTRSPVNANRVKSLPHFCYVHRNSNGSQRNLPSQPEIIRLLNSYDVATDDSQNAESKGRIADGKSGTNVQRNGGSLKAQMIGKKQQTKTGRRRIVCTFCGRPHGDHQKWCIYYTENYGNSTENPAGGGLKRSRTDDDIRSDASEKNINNSSNSNNSDVPIIPRITRSNSNLEYSFEHSNLPNYQSLHRDVYIRALADARARLVLDKTCDFMNQTTKPWIFSYFSSESRKHPKERKIGGMARIFGKKHIDFSEYYKLLANKAELKMSGSEL